MVGVLVGALVGTMMGETLVNGELELDSQSTTMDNNQHLPCMLSHTGSVVCHCKNPKRRSDCFIHYA
jgi:hypothetical protein